MQTAQVEVQGDFIDLGVGQPAPSILPLDLIRRATDHRLAHDSVGYLQYGAEQGDGYFREALARFLTATHGIDSEPDRLFITAGASQALDLISTLFVPTGSVVCVEEPSYFLALNILRDHGHRIVSLPTDEHGLVVNGLETQLADLRPTMLYLVPTFQNPTGATLPLERRERLVDLCRRHGVLLVADEVYHCLDQGAVPPPSFGSYVDGGGVLALGSFSKILAPGLRLGWVQAAPRTVQRMVESGLLDSGGGLNPFVSGLVRSVLELDLERPHLARLRTVFQGRTAAMTEAFRLHLPGATFAEPQGGYFFWLKLPDGGNATRLLSLAKDQRVGFRAGTMFSSREGLPDYLRVSFAFYEEPILVEGVRRLGAAVDRLRST